ncbi:SRPBCC family protein [Micromonospora aurantiaca]|uniref:SRPBCC family protein n=1 Tax=Micromonospora aurantiaca (nom. illeg.) TaxID=47850 RepID=UPI0033B7D013
MDRDSFRPGPLARVKLTPENELVFVRDLRHPPETVWAALTDPDRLAEWAPFLADRDLSRPGDAVLSTVDGDRTHRRRRPGCCARTGRTCWSTPGATTGSAGS